MTIKGGDVFLIRPKRENNNFKKCQCCSFGHEIGYKYLVFGFGFGLRKTESWGRFHKGSQT